VRASEKESNLKREKRKKRVGSVDKGIIKKSRFCWSME
jgi:hypothetical protein